MDAVTDPIADTAAVTEFITRWKGNTGSERANFQSFMRDLCGLLDLPLPDPGKGENAHNAYVFERFIAPQRADSTTEKRYIALYRRDCFVLEGKQTGKALASQSHQNAIGAARSQAERPHTVESLAELFKRKPRKSVEEGLLSLATVGRAEHEQKTDTWYAVG